MLMLSGHLDPARTGGDPGAILESAATSLVEGAIERHASVERVKGPWSR